MRKTKKTPKNKPAKAPKANRFYRPRCPACGHSEFSVFPHVQAELHVAYLENGDVIWRLEDHMQDDADALCCSNCGEETTWAKCDFRRKVK